MRTGDWEGQPSKDLLGRFARHAALRITVRRFVVETSGVRGR
jgi:hypothetical protein